MEDTTLISLEGLPGQGQILINPLEIYAMVRKPKGAHAPLSRRLATEGAAYTVIYTKPADRMFRTPETVTEIVNKINKLLCSCEANDE